MLHDIEGEKMRNNNIFCKHLNAGFECPYNRVCIKFEDNGKNIVFCSEISLILNPLE